MLTCRRMPTRRKLRPKYKKMPTAAKKPATVADDAPAKKNLSAGKPEQKARKEYTGPKVEGESFDD